MSTTLIATGPTTTTEGMRMTTTVRSRRSLTRALLIGACVLAALLFAAVAARPARADFGVKPGTFRAEALDANGDPVNQAGAHPFTATTSFQFNTKSPNGFEEADGNVRDIEVTLPPGMIGNPQATPKCTGQQFQNGSCPISSQVGVTVLELRNGPFVINDKRPVYNMVPPDGVAADFAFKALGIAPVHIRAAVKTDGTFGVDQYSLVTTISKVSSLVALTGSTLTFWGVPADPAHDPDRYDPSSFSFGASTDAPRKPFMTLPSVCGVQGVTKLRVRSWQDPDTWLTYTSDPQTLTGCDRQTFRPTIDVQPDLTQAGAPSGLSVDLAIPQNENPDSLATPPLQKAVVTLPEGVSVSPSAADGLAACSQAQIALGSNADPTCPQASKIGSVEIDTPLLTEPLTGPIYLAAQNDNPFWSTLAIYLVARGPGMILKLPGKLDADPSTGQLTATFDNNPLLPFTHLKLHFKGGSRAPLALPETCGTKATTTQLTSYAGQLATPTSSFTVDSGCDGGAAPSFTAGVVTPLAAASSPFTLTARRADGGSPITSIDVNLPPGLTGRLASVPLCPEAQAAAGTCGDESLVGKVTIGAGPGSNPYTLGGKVYLTGPYDGAPLGLSIVVPAVAGPFNLGTVVVRSAVFVDRHDAHLSVKSDPLPTILQGIPLRLRFVNVTIDRAGFMLNGTSCTARQVTGAVSGQPVSTRFQIGGCADLAFSPKLSASLTGGRSNTKPGRHPGLKVTLTQRSGQANQRSVSLTLPSSLGVQPPAGVGLCTRDQLAAASCPADAQVGTAEAVTPLLKDKLAGPVYLVEGPGGQGLPGLSIFLNGQLSIQVDGTNTLTRSGLRSTFSGLPDVPLSRFTLTLNGGSKGLLSPKADLCKSSRRAQETILAHNGKRVSKSVTLSVSCKGSKSTKSRKTRKARKTHKSRK